MAIWVIVDYSISVDELLVGAGAAVLAAFLVEVATWQAAVRFGARIGWLVPALRLPGQVLADTATVFAALVKRLLRGPSPAAASSDTPEGKLRRAVLVGEQSFAPNKFVLGIDADRGVMVVHKLVLDEGEELRCRIRGRGDRHADRRHPVRPAPHARDCHGGGRRFRGDQRCRR